MSKPPKTIARSVTVTTTALGARGDGIGTYGDEAVYIDGAMAGEVVVTDILRGHDNIQRGFVKDIVQAAPERATPPCPHAADCGGCAVQHMAPDFYRDWKIARLQGALSFAKVEATEWLPPVFIPAGTRRRASLTLLRRNKDLWIGYRRRRSHDIIRAQSCAVLAPALWDRLQSMAPYLHRMVQDNRPASLFLQSTDSGVDVVITGPVGRKGTPDLSVHEAAGEMLNACGVARIGWRAKDRDAVEILLQAGPVLHDFGGLRVTLPVMAFMQPSRDGEAALVRDVLDFAPPSFRKAADLFSGCGTFTGPLLARGPVDAVEGDGPAHNALAAPARTVSGLNAVRRDLFKDPLSPDELDTYDHVVIDPPRAGAFAQVKAIARAEDLASLTYVSCNPATFARDAAILCEHGWCLAKIRPVDQFIWSDHIELTAHFTR